jgi:hypothetical protein
MLSRESRSAGMVADVYAKDGGNNIRPPRWLRIMAVLEEDRDRCRKESIRSRF